MLGSSKDRNVDPGVGRELLSIRLGDQEFALDIKVVREIRGWTPSTPIPHAPAYFRGMINLRGVVMAIVDMASRLGLPSNEPTAASVVVVVEVHDRPFGLLVDGVNDIITVSDDMRQATPSTGGPASQEVVEGLLTLDDRIISIVSIGALIPHETVVSPPQAA